MRYGRLDLQDSELNQKSDEELMCELGESGSSMFLKPPGTQIAPATK